MTSRTSHFARDGGASDSDQRFFNFDQANAVIGVTWVLTAICIAFLAARFFVRLKVTKKIYLDDYIMVVAVVCFSHLSSRYASMLTKKLLGTPDNLFSIYHALCAGYFAASSSWCSSESRYP